ncbi:MAG: molecular chaperone [Candidatus Binatia bacterium]|nr:MAG: molecular chaperone [Fimbriimonadales bacterium]GIW44860.1 MAG: molecular chaperone [Candidatus Binatia bacterium]
MARWLPERWRDALLELRNDVQDALTRWFRRRERAESPHEASESATVVPWGGWTWPAIEVEDKADAIEIRAELPGLSKDDFQLEVVGDYLVLRGEKRQEREERSDSFWYSECTYGAFTRWIPLPAEVNVPAAEAKFRNGRLEVRLPKLTPAKKISVQVR